ncbi:MAG: sigma-54 dependent transcriptional regulator [Kiritimatiellia bacterium]
MSRVLVVDNEASILSVLSTLLKAEGHEVTPVKEPEKARDLIGQHDFDLMISDIRMKPLSGMDLLSIARAQQPQMSVIMLTAYGSIETAIEAMKLGAFDYVTKPFKVDELLIIVQRALDYKAALAENVDLKDKVRVRYQFENIVAESLSMKNVCRMVQKVAPTETSVLISGESGTGKELVAKAIHAYSKRKDNRFLDVNCAALPEPLLESEMFGHVKGAFTGASANKKGLFEAAEKGTIFLDEVGSMPLSIQGKLLRVLQEKEIRRVGGNENIPVDARVVAATNTDLEELTNKGEFRQDLFYRLSVIPIHIEPLRSRKEDIMPLVFHFVRSELGPDREKPGVSSGALRILENYPWPGNARELQNCVKHALTFCRSDEITKDVLPPKIVEAARSIRTGGEEASDESMRYRSLRDFLHAKEKEYLEQVIDAMNGDKEAAANALKISLATLYRKLSREQKRGGPESEGEASPLASGEES